VDIFELVMIGVNIFPEVKFAYFSRLPAGWQNDAALNLMLVFVSFLPEKPGIYVP